MGCDGEYWRNELRSICQPSTWWQIRSSYLRLCLFLNVPQSFSKISVTQMLQELHIKTDHNSAVDGIKYDSSTSTRQTLTNVCFSAEEVWRPFMCYMLVFVHPPYWLGDRKWLLCIHVGLSQLVNSFWFAFLAVANAVAISLAFPWKIYKIYINECVWRLICIIVERKAGNILYFSYFQPIWKDPTNIHHLHDLIIPLCLTLLLLSN